MTLPFLLLGLYLGLLVVAIGLSSYTGHSCPEPDEARRVSDAAERAALGHLLAPAKLTGIATVLFSLSTGTLAILREQDVVWFVLAPLLAPPLVGAALFYCSRKALRVSGQLVGVVGADARVVLASRAALGIVLCCEATIGLVLLGAHALLASQLDASQARLLVYLAGSSIALAAVVFGRATTSAQYVASAAEKTHGEDPHPGSLAVLVASTFHSPLLRLLGLVALSSLGHCALLSMDAQTTLSSETLWLYPHLLKLLGLFGLVFALLVVRTSEDESGSEGWIRGAAVYLALMIAGAWSLSSELPESWARTVPAGLSFLYVAVGLSLWIARGPSHLHGGGLEAHIDDRSGGDAETTSLGRAAIAKIPPMLLLSVLLGVLTFATSLPSGATEAEHPTLPTGALMSLLLAGTLAASPITFSWLLGRDWMMGSHDASLLAYVGQPAELPERTSPSTRLTLALPLLAFVVSATALNAGLSFAETPDGLALTLLGIGAAVGALVIIALTGQIELSGMPGSRAIAKLIAERSGSMTDTAPLDFESAVTLCRESVGRSHLAWLMLCLFPTAVTLLARGFVPPGHFQSLALGLGLGSVLLGVGMEYLESGQRAARRPLAHLAFLTCISQAIWLLTAGSLSS